MPHISMKMYPGRSADEKKVLAKKMRDFLVDTMKIDQKYISVSVEDVKPENWNDMVKKIPQSDLYIKADF